MVNGVHRTVDQVHGASSMVHHELMVGASREHTRV
jgi:hypothetical protein